MSRVWAMSLTDEDKRWIEDQLRREPDAIEHWQRWGSRLQSKRLQRFTKEHMVAYCRNAAEQAARRVSHDTGAMKGGR